MHVPVRYLSEREEVAEGVVYGTAIRTGSAHQQYFHVRLSARVQLTPKTASAGFNFNTSCYAELVKKMALKSRDFPQRGVFRVTCRPLDAGDGFLYPAFWCHVDSVDVGEEDVPLVVSFLPTRLGVHDAHLVFEHVDSGAQYSLAIQGVSKPAAPNAVLTWQCELSAPQTHVIKVPFVNGARREAFTHISRATAQLKNVTLPQLGEKRRASELLHLKTKVSGCPHALCPPELTLKSADQDKDEASAELPVEFKPVAVGTYSFSVTLQGSGDTRVFRIIAHVVEAKKVNLACKAVVGSSSTLEAVLYNPCSSERTFRAGISGSGVFSLSHVSTFCVPACSEHVIDVRFEPTEEGVFYGTLLAHDELVGVAHTFSIHGVCEQHKSRLSLVSTASEDHREVVRPAVPLVEDHLEKDFAALSAADEEPEEDSEWICEAEMAFAKVDDVYGLIAHVSSGTRSAVPVTIRITGDDASAYALLKPRKPRWACSACITMSRVFT